MIFEKTEKSSLHSPPIFYLLQDGYLEDGHLHLHLHPYIYIPFKRTSITPVKGPLNPRDNSGANQEPQRPKQTKRLDFDSRLRDAKLLIRNYMD